MKKHKVSICVPRHVHESMEAVVGVKVGISMQSKNVAGGCAEQKNATGLRKKAFGRKTKARMQPRKILCEAIAEEAAIEASMEEEEVDAVDTDESHKVDDRTVADDGMSSGDGVVQAARREPGDGGVVGEDVGGLQQFATELGAAGVGTRVGHGDARKL